MSPVLAIPYGTFRYRDRLILVCGAPGSPHVDIVRVSPSVLLLGTVDIRHAKPMLRSTLPREQIYNYGVIGREAAEIVRAATADA